MPAEIDDSAVAVIGMVGRFPGAENLDQFWRNLREGVESIRRLSDQELRQRGADPELVADPHHVPAVAEIDHADCFDAEFFGINPREAEIMDPQQRIFLQCAWQALESAGYDPERCGDAVALFAGATASTYLVYNLLSHGGFEKSWDPLELLVANAGDSLATRVSYKLNLKGPSFAVQCACSTSLVAVHLACESLLNEACDLALAGGISINAARGTGYLYRPGSIDAPDGHCRPFDAQAQGTVFGSGVGIVVLKRLADAIADGDPIRAVVKGSAINNDGGVKVGYTAPGVEGQTEVIAEALSVADLPAESISYLEAHGTATELGDPIEIQALTRAFRTFTDRTGFCALGSVKSNIGHIDVAAGIAGLIKTVLALEHRQIPPSLHFTKPSPKIDFDRSPVFVNAELREWPAGSTPRRAGVSSFGFGGTNAHLILEEAPARPTSEAGRRWQLLVLSAKERGVLDEATANLAAHCDQHPDLNLADAAFTLARGRKAFTHRRIAVCRDPADAARCLESRDPERVLTRADTLEPRARPVVFMFSGQGAQHPNMGRELYEQEPVFRAAVDRCAERLEPLLGLDLRRLLYPPAGEEEEAGKRLEETALTQPALFVTEYALAQLWMEWGVRPAAMIGHSIGEYVAATLAGVFFLQDALAVVAARGRLMQEMPPGSMLGVPLPEDEVGALLSPGLALAAVNAPGQCTVSGPEEAISALAQRLAEREIDGRRLHTSHAFHSEMMDPILERFATEVGGVRRKAPEIPFLSNLSGTWVTPEQATDPGYWTRHLRQTVRFADGIGELVADPERILLEIGPGDTLVTLARRHPEKPTAIPSMRHPRTEGSDLAVLLTALGRLWLAGREIDWTLLFAGQKRRRLALPNYPFARRSFWVEPGRPTPGKAMTVGKVTEIADWFYLPSWRQTLPPRPGELAGRRRFLVFADPGGLGQALAERLRAADQEVFTVTAGSGYARTSDDTLTIAPGRSEDYDQLLAALPGPVETVVHLWNVAPHPDSGPEAFAGAQERGFCSLLALAQALGRREVADDLQLVVGVNDLHDLTGRDPSCPEKSTLVGPCLVLPQEQPGITCRVLDLGMGEGVPPPLDALLAEIRSRSQDPVVAWRGPRRWVQSFEPVRLPGDGEGRLRQRGVYLITGSVGTVGLEIAEILAREFEARLVLLLPPGFPEPADWDRCLAAPGDEAPAIRRLQALEAAGAELLAVAAELTDEAAMSAALARAGERFGTLHGVIWAAGAPAADVPFHSLAEISCAAAEADLRATAEGLCVLDRLVAGREVDFVLLITSTAAVLGGLGRVAEAAAGRFMNAFAAQRRWLSASWDPWPAAGGMEAGTDPLALTAEERRDALLRLLAQAPPGPVVVSAGDLAARMALWLQPAAPAERRGTLHERPDLETDYAAPRTETESRIAALWEDLLGVRPIGIHDNFFELGGHSLLGTQVRSRLRRIFQVDLPLERLFEAPTVAGTAVHVETAQWALRGKEGLSPEEAEDREEGEL